MMHEPSTAPEPQGWDPEEEDHSPCPQDHGDEEYSAGPDAASMEGAISKFMEGLEGQERSGFQCCIVTYRSCGVQILSTVRGSPWSATPDLRQFGKDYRNVWPQWWQTPR